MYTICDIHVGTINVPLADMQLNEATRLAPSFILSPQLPPLSL